MEAVTHKKGDSFNKVLRVRTKVVDDDTGAISYTAVDLTGATIWFTIKKQKTDPDVAVEADEDEGILAQDGALLLKEIGPNDHTNDPPEDGLSSTQCTSADMDFAVCPEGESYYAEFQVLDSAGGVMSSETFVWKQMQDLTQVKVATP